jgi:hypothetical protein
VILVLSVTLGGPLCFSLASAVRSFTGIRVMLLVRKRCPCAGRHLLFFAAAKKSRRVLKFEVQHPASYKVLLWKNDTNNSSLKSG